MMGKGWSNGGWLLDNESWCKEGGAWGGWSGMKMWERQEESIDDRILMIMIKSSDNHFQLYRGTGCTFVVQFLQS